MTTTTATTSVDANTTDANSTDASAELLLLDPTTLELDRNVRDTVDTDSESFTALVDSIRQHGVLQAVSATRDRDGTIKVEDGQRRTLAARHAEAATIPVVVTTRTETGKAREFTRIVSQIEANDRRQDLTEGQRAAAVADMLDLGISHTKIKKALQLKPDQLKQQAKVGKSAAARDALDSGQLDLEQAAIVGAFEAEGDTDAVERLLSVPGYNFRFTANAIVAERAETRERSAAATAWTERGFVLLDREPALRGSDYLHVDGLIDTATGEAATVVHVDADPAQWWIWLHCERGGLVTLTATGERIDDDQVDWSTEGDTGAQEAEEGLYHCRQVEISDAWTVDYYTTADRLDSLGLRTVEVGARVSGADPSDPTDPDTIAAEVARKAAQDKEAERALRRKVLRFNRLGDAAIATRRAWLLDYLTRKTPPQTAATFVLGSLAGEAFLLTQHTASATTAELLGVDAEKLHGTALATWIDTLTPARAQVVTLALVLGAYEARTTKDAWRRNSYGGDHGVAHYLHFVASLGYPLSQIEEVMTGDRPEDDVDPDQ